MQRRSGGGAALKSVARRRAPGEDGCEPEMEGRPPSREGRLACARIAGDAARWVLSGDGGAVRGEPARGDLARGRHA